MNILEVNLVVLHLSHCHFVFNFVASHSSGFHVNNKP